jgi:hypothetical protein
MAHRTSPPGRGPNVAPYAAEALTPRPEGVPRPHRVKGHPALDPAQPSDQERSGGAGRDGGGSVTGPKTTARRRGRQLLVDAEAMVREHRLFCLERAALLDASMQGHGPAPRPGAGQSRQHLPPQHVDQLNRDRVIWHNRAQWAGDVADGLALLIETPALDQLVPAPLTGLAVLFAQLQTNVKDLEDELRAQSATAALVAQARRPQGLGWASTAG